MSRVKLLLNVISDLNSLAESLKSVADAIMQNDAVEDDSPEQAIPPKNNDAATSTNESPKPEPTIEQVRAVLVELSHDGHTEQVHDLLLKYGASKLSAVDKADYADLLKDAEAIRNAT